jgi:hypothetical protein
MSMDTQTTATLHMKISTLRFLLKGEQHKFFRGFTMIRDGP